jgi:GNAT superfamily N-acetyltransferase
VRGLTPGWETDLAILELGGSTVEDRGDHLVVRTAANPDYHWGNCVFVLDPAAVDDAQRWVDVFAEAFPAAGWVAIALPVLPAAAAAWTRHGVRLELDEVLTTRTLPVQTPAPDGYAVRRLDGDDWEHVVTKEMAENARTEQYEEVGHERFVRAMVTTRSELSGRGAAAFFGAFHDGRLVADLGIVRCGSRARYQAVGTEPDHRGRGLASHLLGVAAAWAAQHGCDEWVIVTASTNPAGRVYRRAGFAPDAANVEAYRAPGPTTLGGADSPA